MGWIISYYFIDDIVVKIPIIHSAFAFVHGGYDYDEDLKANTHFTIYKHQKIPTIDFVEALKFEGYDYVWGTWCGSGDHDYIIMYDDGEQIMWPDWVSRNEKPGNIWGWLYGG